MNKELPVSDPFWDSFFKSDIHPPVTIGDHQQLKEELASANLKLSAYRDELKDLQTKVEAYKDLYRKLSVENALLIKLIKGTV